MLGSGVVKGNREAVLYVRALQARATDEAIRWSNTPYVFYESLATALHDTILILGTLGNLFI
jgi:hypothetical protein